MLGVLVRAAMADARISGDGRCPSSVAWCSRARRGRRRGFGPRAHVQRRAVQRGGWRPRGWGAHVEPHGEHCFIARLAGLHRQFRPNRARWRCVHGRHCRSPRPNGPAPDPRMPAGLQSGRARRRGGAVDACPKLVSAGPMDVVTVRFMSLSWFAEPLSSNMYEPPERVRP